jgi:2,3-bisphosphoglycerate-dependent phosphoglycerate mutase
LPYFLRYFFRSLIFAENFAMRNVLLVLLWSIVGIAQAQAQASIIFLVRHCEKALESTNNPNLAEEGHKRAQHLAEILKNAGIEAVYSTNTKRTMQTGEPLAKAMNLNIQVYEPKDSTFAQTLRQAGKKILVVGHSNTVPELLNQLMGTETYQPNDLYGDLWVVNLTEKEKALVLRLSF